MTSVAERTRRKRKRLLVERAKTQPSAPTVSRIEAARKHVETKTAKEDAPFAEKRKNTNPCPVHWLIERKLITQPQHKAAVEFARDWFDSQATPRTTATMEPRGDKGHDDWDHTDVLEAHGRFRWIEVRLTGEAWKILQAVVLHEMSVGDWITGLKTKLAEAKKRHDAIRSQRADAVSLRPSAEQRLLVAALEKKLQESTNEINELMVTIVDKHVAMRHLRTGLDELILLRREYWIEHGEDGLQPGMALTPAAEVERRELLGV